MSEKSVALFKWAETDFLFEEMLENNFNVKRYKVSHSEQWFSKRSYWGEVKHLFNSIFKPLKSSREKSVVLFGTNLCRMLFFLPSLGFKVIFVYNEMPDSRRRLIQLIDRFNMKRHSKRVFVSSIERKVFLNNKHGVELGGVVSNLPSALGDGSELAIVPEGSDSEKIVYCGLLNSNRFSSEDWDKLMAFGLPIELYGPKMNDFVKADNDAIQYKGKVSSSEVAEILKNSKYALLSYTTEDTNNDYCAPIKVYEYIQQGCICVSVNSNKGLLRYFSQYPDLFVTLDSLVNFKFDAVKYKEQRERFLQQELAFLATELDKLKLLL